MSCAIGACVWNFLMTLVLDIRFLVIVGLVVAVQWIRRLPRPKKDPRKKTVFITGCDTGMGHRMARRFDEMGMHVYAGCLQPEGKGATELKELCSKRIHIVPLDITKDDQVQKAVAYVKENLPPGSKGLYCLVNNAGVLAYVNLELMTMKMCEEVVMINLMGTIRVTKHFLPLLCETPGRIVTITSILARLVYPRVSIYAATKHGLNGFISALRYELLDKGIRVATVEPGDFSSTTDIMQWTQRHLDDMWENMSPEDRKTKLHLFERVKNSVRRTKLAPSDQEKVYKMLLDDVEDAMLAEEPHWRYVSAPCATRTALSVFRCLPESWTYKIMDKP